MLGVNRRGGTHHDRVEQARGPAAGGRPAGPRLWGLYENIDYERGGGRQLLIGRDWRGPLAPKYDFAKITSSLIWIAN
ncbi:Uncharacterised protein [Amycolatopsis camponoti]|uniref:Uncharacterized protein n=1 Tax=Amycolatopsis camponoti TaxID=2606593 RepID=A0A6I8MA22_9PSEU|nr:hypothetical protein [Amycolatopsis camponoti]VVJ24592.1 Uncharacterised protein [Amycolatopsis camponoti]